MWQLFVSTFTLIFIAELPDKTAFAALLLATRHHPVAVFIGAAVAFTIQSLVAVMFGSLLSVLPPTVIHWTAGILFLGFAISMWLRKEHDASTSECQSPPCFAKSVSAAFLVIFLAEWGDLTQLATATLAAQYHAPITIFGAATLALWVVTAIGVGVGSYLKHWINPALIQRGAALAFATAGAVLLVHP